MQTHQDEQPPRQSDGARFRPSAMPVERDEPAREIPEWETKLGKTIFYLTIALGLWFFYWLNGIQCPC